MEQKKIFRTIETVASKKFETDKSMLVTVIDQLVSIDSINITGGRVWQLLPEKKAYSLIYQTGNISKIEDNFLLFLKDNPVLKRIVKEKTILADETNKALRSKGIFKYSASGVGSRIKINHDVYYQYLIAVNSDHVDSELRDTLNIVATVLSSKLRERKISDSQKTLMADIDSARQLQKSLLPEHEFSFYNYDLFGVTLPAENIGGDFFDYVNIGEDEDRVGIVVGDAASKGLSAAAEAMYISGAIRMASTFQIKISPFMNRMNQLVNKIFRDIKFTSLFYGEISKDKKGLFLYANAGHNPPIFYTAKDNCITYLQPTGPLLGIAPKSKYETDSINFSTDDVLVIFSDGIVDAADGNFDFYEEKRLEKIIRKTKHLSPKSIAHAIIDDVYKFSTPNSKYQDDKTVVVIKRKEL